MMKMMVVVVMMMMMMEMIDVDDNDGNYKDNGCAGDETGLTRDDDIGSISDGVIDD